MKYFTTYWFLSEIIAEGHIKDFRGDKAVLGAVAFGDKDNMKNTSEINNSCSLKENRE